MPAILALLTATQLVFGSGPVDEEDGPLRVCLISGSWEYRSEETLPAFAAYLEANYPAECTVLQAASVNELPGLEALETSDVALVFTRRLEIDGEPLERIKAFAANGKPIVGVRTASHGFQNWLEIDGAVFGGNYHGHLSNDLETDVAVVPGAEAHPTIEGARPGSTPGSLYQVTPLASDCRVLLRGTSPEGSEPVAWTRERLGGRVFYTSLGHPEDFEHEWFRRMLAEALFWTARRDPIEP